jgi:hypothetical protein
VAEEEVQDGEHIDEDALPSDDDVTQQLQHLSFAKVASGKVERKRYPDLLYVHLGGDKKQSMSRATWAVFAKKLSARLVDLDIAGQPTPDSDWTGWQKGMGLIAVTSPEAQAQMKVLIAETKVAEFTFRGWAKGEAGKYRLVTADIPAIMESVPAGKLMGGLCKKHGLPDGSKGEYVLAPKPGGKGPTTQRQLRIMATDEFIEALERKNFKTVCALQELTWWVYGRKQEPGKETQT